MTDWHVRLIKGDSRGTRIWTHTTQQAAEARADALADLHSLDYHVDQNNHQITVDATGYYEGADTRRQERERILIVA